MNNATTQTSMQKNVGIAIPIVMGVITCFQPAAVQIYFFISTLLASITSKSLQNPAIRRFLRIRALPTAESNALASRVIQGKVKLDAIPSPSRQVRYQAPRASTPSSPSPSTSKPSSSKPRKPIQNIGTIKRGLRVPAHMTHIPRIPAKNNKKKPGVRIPNLGVPKGGVGVKWEWLKSTIRNKLTSDQRDPGVIAREKKRVRAQEAVRKYELEKKKRFEN
jgi:YidC/Oxa1 family membrane protein insertase